MDDYITPTNDIDYSCLLKAIELIDQTYGSISHHITPLGVHNLGGRHTHTHTHAYRHSRIQTFTYRSNSKKLGIHLV